MTETTSPARPKKPSRWGLMKEQRDALALRVTRLENELARATALTANLPEHADETKRLRAELEEAQRRVQYLSPLAQNRGALIDSLCESLADTDWDPSQPDEDGNYRDLTACVEGMVRDRAEALIERGDLRLRLSDQTREASELAEKLGRAKAELAERDKTALVEAGKLARALGELETLRPGVESLKREIAATEADAKLWRNSCRSAELIAWWAWGLFGVSVVVGVIHWLVSHAGGVR